MNASGGGSPSTSSRFSAGQNSSAPFSATTTSQMPIAGNVAFSSGNSRPVTRMTLRPESRTASHGRKRLVVDVAVLGQRAVIVGGQGEVLHPRMLSVRTVNSWSITTTLATAESRLSLIAALAIAPMARLTPPEMKSDA